MNAWKTWNARALLAPGVNYVRSGLQKVLKFEDGWVNACLDKRSANSVEVALKKAEWNALVECVECMERV